MRKSQIAVLSAIAAFALVIVAAIVAARIIVAQIGTGEYADEPRVTRSDAAASSSPDLMGFDRIDARGTWEIDLVQGASWDVELEYPENLEEKMRVSVVGDRLILDYDRPGWSWWRDRDDGVAARITMPALESVDLSGAAQLDIAGFNGEELEIRVSGAAEIDGRNSRYVALDLTVSGAGDVNLGDAVFTDAHIVVSGAGDILLNLDGGVLSGTISGAGKVRYRGSVREQSIVASGFSTVEAAN